MNESTIGFALPIGDTSTPLLHGVGRKNSSSLLRRKNSAGGKITDDIMRDSFNFSSASASFDLSTSSLYEWNSFKNNYAQLILTDLISDTCSRDCEAKDNLPTNDVDMLRELFRENASCLFHDIVDTLNCPDIAQNDIDDLTRRYDDFSKRTGILETKVPSLSDEINSRLKSIRLQLNVLMESAQTKRSETNCSTADAGYASLQQLRKWLQFIAVKMNSVEEQNVDCLNVGDLQRVLDDQQALQVELQRDGGALLSAAKKHCSALCSSNRADSPTSSLSSKNVVSSDDEKKYRLVFQSLERRWHCLWIKSLERQYVLEAYIKQIELGVLGEGDSDSKLFEPVTKRRRLDGGIFLVDTEDQCDSVYQYSSSGGEHHKSNAADCCSVTSDTIPFSESEYESIMEGAAMTTDANGNFYSPISRDFSDDDVDDDNVKLIETNFISTTTSATLVIENTNKIDNYDVLSVQDVGYASENSMHMSSNDESMLDCSTTFNNNNNQIELTSCLALNDYDERVTRSPSAPSLCFVGGKIKDKFDSGDNNKVVDIKTSWSTSSSPSLERRNRIHNSPIKEYYKMLPDPADVDSDAGKTSSDENRHKSNVPDDVRYIYTTKLRSNNIGAGKQQEMTDSLVVNVSESVENIYDLNEINALLDESFEQRRPTDELVNSKIDQMLGCGTTWKPFVGSKKDLQLNDIDDMDDSCDASSELSADDKFRDDDLRTPRAFSNVDRGSLKRRWRRPTSTCLAEMFPSSVSENAIMSLSLISTSSTPSCAGGGGGILSRQRHHQRKKLKAHRIPRSISDSEHLSVLALCNRPLLPYWSNPRLDYVPPCTPRGDSLVSDSDETELDEEGAGEGMAEHEERMAGDGGSSVSAEQSESVWEWDDYKPPNHCEVGPLDNRLDDSNLTEFGDDYRLCLDSAPMSARSDISESVSTSPGIQRLPPVGYAGQESDSEPDDLSRFVDESRRRLRWARQNLNSQKRLNDVCSLCMREIHYLDKLADQTDVGERRTLKSRKRTLPCAVNLRKLWEGLLAETRFKQSARDDAVVKMIHKLGQSLKEFMEYLRFCPLSVPRLTTSSSYDDLLKEILMLKEASTKIENDRKNLNDWLNEDSFNDCPELKMCTFDYDIAAEKCGNQLKLMENLYKILVEWKNIEAAYKSFVENLENKLSSASRPACDKSSPSLVLPDYASIQLDIESCEDRLNRLETVCNQLCSSIIVGAVHEASLYDRFSNDLRDQLNVYRRQLEALKSQFTVDLPSASLSSQEEIVVDDDGTLSNTVRRHRKSSTTVGRQKRTSSIDVVTKKRQIAAASDVGERTPSPKVTSLKTFRRMLRTTWPLQLCLILAVCLGIYFFQADCCNDTNYWNWAFGPRLDYVRGPPPS